MKLYRYVSHQRLHTVTKNHHSYLSSSWVICPWLIWKRGFWPVVHLLYGISEWNFTDMLIIKGYILWLRIFTLTFPVHELSTLDWSEKWFLTCTSFVDLLCFCSVLCLLCFVRVCLLCFVVTCWERADLLALVCGVFCEFVTFPLVSWVRCGTWLYRFLIFATLLL